MKLPRLGFVGFISLTVAMMGLEAGDCLAPPSGLTAWWAGEGDTRDSVGNTLGQWDGAAQYTEGKVGQAFQFDGVSSAVVISASSGTDAGTGAGMTVAAWVKPAGGRHIMWIGWTVGESSYGPYGYFLADDSIYFNVVDSQGDSHPIASAPGALVPGEWQHVALTYDEAGGTAAIYRNGVAIAQETLGSFRVGTAGRGIVLGRQPPQWAYAGLLDEVMLFNRALPQVEVAALHAAESAGVCRMACVMSVSGQKAWWPGDGHFHDLAGTNHAAAGGDVSFVPGRVGKAFRFVDSASSWLEMPNDPEFQPAQQLTIEAWVKPDYSVTGDKLDTLFGRRDGCDASFAYLFCIGKGHRGWQGNLIFAMPGVVADPAAVSTIPVPDDGHFHHVAVTFNGDRARDNGRLYLDGQVVGSFDAPGTVPFTARGPVVGRHAECGYYSSMDLDELAYYTRELAGWEIEAIHAAGAMGKCKPPVPYECLTGWWRGENDARDALGRYPGRMVGGAGFAEGVRGTSFRPGTGQVDLGLGPALDSFTVAAWIWVDPALNTGEQRCYSRDNYNLAGDRKAVILKSTSATNTGHDGWPLLEILASGHYQNLAVPEVLSAGWHHLAAVRDVGGGRLELYVDGVLAASDGLLVPDAIDSDVGTVLSGISLAEPIELFHGRVDEVTLHGCALSATLIRAMAQPARMADLVLESVVVPATGVFGSPIPVSWTVRNGGADGLTGFWMDRLWLSTTPEPGGGVVLLDHPVTGVVPLPPGATYTLSASVTPLLTLGLGSGDYYLGVTADGRNGLVESNEVNNAKTGSVIRLTLPPLPDLGVGGIVGPALATPGQSIAVSWGVTNQGALPAAGPWTETVYFAPAADSASALALGSLTISEGLAAGTSVVRTQTVTVPHVTAGLWRLGVAVDSTGRIASETTKTNNLGFAAGVIEIEAGLTLEVSPADVDEDAANPAVHAVVRRNGDLANALEVVLTTSPAGVLVAPGRVVIPAGEGGAGVDLSVLPNGVVDGGRLCTLDVSAAGYEGARATVAVRNTDVHRLTLELAAASALEGRGTIATVTRDDAGADVLLVRVRSSDPRQVLVPDTVMIPAGQTRATFSVVSIDDGLIEATQPHTITVSATGLASATRAFSVLDNDGTILRVDVPFASLGEADGLRMATVSRETAGVPAVLLELEAIPADQLWMPARAVIPSGETSVSIPLAPLDNGLVDGTRTVEIRAYVLDSVTGDRLAEAIAGRFDIVDNDGPALTLTTALAVVAEGMSPATTGTVTRNVVDAAEPLVVMLTSSDPGEATVPATAVIPAHAASAAFDIATPEDGVGDGNQRVVLRAAADGYGRGTTTLVVADRDLPDLVLRSLVLPAQAVAGGPLACAVEVANAGLSAAAGPIEQWLYLSADPVKSDDDTFLGSITLGGTLAVGGSVTRTNAFAAPGQPGDYWLIAVADAGDHVEEILEDNNVAVASQTVTVVTPYSATVETDIESAVAGTAIPLRGTATRVDGSPAAFESVWIHVSVRGTRRVLEAQTAGDGTFRATFRPLPSEAGRYEIGATHPADSRVEVQDEFILLGMGLTPESISQSFAAFSTNANEITLVNASPMPLTGIQTAVEGVGANLDFQVEAPSSIGGNSTAVVRYTLRVGDDSVPAATIHVRFSSAEGATADFRLALRVRPASTRLATAPGYLEATMVRGQRSQVRFEVINIGGAASGDLDVLLPAIDWLSLVSPQRMPSLNPGERASVDLALSPPADLGLGPYAGVLALSGVGGTASVSFRFTAVSDQQGALLVSVSDDYTYTMEGAPKVTNAWVRLTDPVTGGELGSAVTGGNGEVLLRNLAEAYYRLTVHAEGHSDYISTLLLAPGRTNRVDAFLPRQFVSYAWDVVPIEVEDRYEFQLEAKYETHVPAPVITLDPPSFDLRTVQGDLAQINVTVSNQGLITARDVRFTPPSDPRWRITPLSEDLGDLPALSSVVVPVTIERLPEAPGALAGHVGKAPAGGRAGLMGGGIDIPLGNGCVITLSMDWWYPCGPENRGLYVPLFFINPSPECYGQPPRPEIPPRRVELWPEEEFVYIPPPARVDPPPREERVEPVSFEPPTFSWLRSIACSPCLTSIAKCGIDLFDVVPDTGECLMDAASCVKGLTGLKWSWLSIGSTAYNCMKAAGKCTKRFAESFKKLNPYCKAFDCLAELGEGCLGIDFGGEGTLGRVRLLSAGGGSEEAMLREYLLRTETVVDVFLAEFGDAAWVRVIDVAAAEAWLEGFDQAREDASDAGDGISDAERAQLLAQPLPPPITVAQAGELIDRWNRTLAYWRQDWLRASDVPAGQNTNFLALDVWTNVVQRAAAAFEASAFEGFPLILDGLSYAQELYVGSKSEASGGSCAQVSLKLQQTMAITRTAFEGTLDIHNGSGDPIRDILVTLEILGPDGQPANDRFGIRDPRLVGMTGVDGGGVLADQAAGKAIWVFVPTRDAAPTAPVTYTIGGRISYTQAGERVTQSLFPVPIQVLPDPLLVVKYFWPRDVDGDDPFTPEIDPAEPFPLGLMISNQGHGTARNVRVTSGLPEIVDNEKGLLIDFRLVASQVGTNDVTPSLSVALGDLPPGDTGVAAWWMTASLQGRFVDYQASFTHVDALGDARLSLIDRVEVHELVRRVFADQPANDGVADFLANDVADLQHLPDTLHLSTGGTLPVATLSGGVADGSPSEQDLAVDLTVSAPTAWGYLRIADPAAPAYALVRVARSDGRELRVGDNVWRTSRVIRREGEPDRVERWLHLLDFGGTGRYALTYAAPAGVDTQAPVSAVEALPVISGEAIPVRWSGEDPGGSGLASFDVFVSVNGGPVSLWLDRTSLNGAVYAGVLGNRYAFYSVATDGAGNREPAPATPDAATVVSLSNTAPVVTVPGPQSVDELTPLVVQIRAEDAESAAGGIVYQLESGPPGVILNPSTGWLTWVPGEEDGPGTHAITVRVLDDGEPPLSRTGSFLVAVREMNQTPRFAPASDVAIEEGQPIALNLAAVDDDLPPNELTYSLGAGAPDGVALDPATGVMTWVPREFQGPSTNVIGIHVTDDGRPSLGATQQVTIVVGDTQPDFRLWTGVTNLLDGATGRVPIRLEAGVPLVRLSFELVCPTNVLTGGRLVSRAAEVGEATLTPVEGGGFQVEIAGLGGATFGGAEPLAWFEFDVPAGQRSARIELETNEPWATIVGGRRLTGVATVGQVIVVGAEPLLEAVLPTSGEPSLVLYGRPGMRHVIERLEGDLGRDEWTTHSEFTSAGTREVLPLLPDPARKVFYRAHRKQ